MNVRPADGARRGAPAQRAATHPLLRMTAGVACLLLAFALPRGVIETLPGSEELHEAWRALLGALCLYYVYKAYARVVEQREASELAVAGCWRDAGSGITAGAALFGLALGMLYMAGAYEVTGIDLWASVTAALCAVLVAGLLEELVMRGVLFRIAEPWLGTWPVLAASMLLCAMLRMADGDANWIGMLSAAIQALLLGAAYIATRRLWLGLGIQAAWSIAQDGIFALPAPEGRAKGSSLVY